MSWDEASFVVRGKIRKAVLAKLRNPMTPTLLSKELHTSVPNISRTLRELQAADLIESLTPKARAGKIFRATAKGQLVLKRLEEMGT